MDIYSDKFIQELLKRLRIVVSMADSQVKQINNKGTSQAENITTLRMISQVAEDIHVLILAHLYDPATTEFTISGLSSRAINPDAAPPGSIMTMLPLVEKI